MLFHCNNQHCRFGLSILSLWPNIVLLQLNNSYNICSSKIPRHLSHNLFKKEPIFAIIDSINELQYCKSPLGNNHKTSFSISPNPSMYVCMYACC